MHSAWACTHPPRLNPPRDIRLVVLLQSRGFRLRLRLNTLSLPRGSFCERSRLASKRDESFAHMDMPVCTLLCRGCGAGRASEFLSVSVGTVGDYFATDYIEEDWKNQLAGENNPTN